VKAKSPGFLKQVIYTSAAVLIIGIYPVWTYADRLQIYSIISGFIIGLLNAFIGYRLTALAFNKPVKKFMAIVFGGMGVRIAVIFLFLAILLYAVKLDENSLIGSVFFFYVLFVSLEINYFHRKHHNIA
jgi:hypothetical protein